MSALLAIGEGWGETVTGGSMLLALPVAAAAGLISFLSPCVLPLVPGYLSYVTGAAGADLADSRRVRVVSGSALFVLGFSAVFVATGALFGGLGAALVDHQDVLTRVLGAATIVLGLGFLGVIPALQREVRVHKWPALGLVGAPLLGVLFGLGWTPCIGPTLGAVQTLALSQAGAGRGAVLTLAYSLGLGLPFVLAALAYRQALGVFGWVKRHYVWVMRTGGAMLVLLGVLLVTGTWQELSLRLVSWTSQFTPAV